MFDGGLILPVTMLSVLGLAILGALVVGVWGVAHSWCGVGAVLGFAADVVLLGDVGAKRKRSS